MDRRGFSKLRKELMVSVRFSRWYLARVVAIGLFTFLLGFLCGGAWSSFGKKASSAPGRGLATRRTIDLVNSSEFAIFTVVYGLGERNEWRWPISRQNAEINDQLIRDAGLPGLTILTPDEAVSQWNVHRVLLVPDLREGCRMDEPLCPKINMLASDAFWEKIAKETIFFLDADARILNTDFVHGAAHYTMLPIDYAAAPDAQLWENYGMVEDAPYNTGVYFMRLSAFRTPELASIVDRIRNTNGEEIRRDQLAVNSYLAKRKGSIRTQHLPWKMHCRSQFISKTCWLIHGWHAFTQNWG